MAFFEFLGTSNKRADRDGRPGQPETDSVGSTSLNRLGEAIAISVLRDQRGCYNEDFDGFTFTTFDGEEILV
jgi:hypothetical protein